MATPSDGLWPVTATPPRQPNGRSQLLTFKHGPSTGSSWPNGDDAGDRTGSAKAFRNVRMLGLAPDLAVRADPLFQPFPSLPLTDPTKCGQLR
jgi:hypothetical protein